MKKLTAKRFLVILKEYLMVTLGGAINAVSLFTFINPNKMIAGGFSGLASALSYVFELFIKNISYDKLMSIMYFVLNVPLLICSLIFLRGDFTFKTIWATIVSSIVLAILPPQFKFNESRLVSTIFGGILVGVAMFVAYNSNGSNGGTEIIGRIVNKYHPEVDISKVILMSNFCITISGSIVVMVIKGERVAIILYSLLYVIIGGNVLGMLKRGFDHPQKFLITTTKYEEIGLAISENFRRGFTVMDVKNSYDGQTRKMVMVVVQYRQMHTLKKIIKQYDPQAFTVIKDVHDVFSRPSFNRSYKTK